MGLRSFGTVVLTIVLGGCGGGGNDHDSSSGGSAASGAVDSGIVPSTSPPPVGVTWNVGVNNNVSQATLESLFASLVGINNALWNISEGQIYVGRIRIWDNVAPWFTVSMVGSEPLSTSTLDLLAFVDETWDISDSYMVWLDPTMGRSQRLMAFPLSTSTFIGLHAASHMLFQLTWWIPVLADEYSDGVQDSACVMESEALPWRWCSSANHAAQAAQPTSCWGQILTDYPLLSHSGSDSATSPAPLPIVEYFNSAP